ncbi:MAG: hypothetical protein KAY50_09800 [Chitinophagaceae bacterium]|nr:hypothetical protein [Chitinophagaceae bacterium]
MKRIIDKMKAEESTGIVESKSGIGTLYENGGGELSMDEAKNKILNGGSVEVPNAGSGSYNEFFCQICEFNEIKVIDWGSSAGDWSFGVRNGEVWYWAGQSNRYPGHGFEYNINPHWPHNSFENLISSI